MSQTASASVLAFLRHDGEILLVRGGDTDPTGSGRWGTVSIPIGASSSVPSTANVRKRLAREGHVFDATLVRVGEFDSGSSDRDGIVYPALFDCASREVELPTTTVEREWVAPTAIHRRSTVDGLWTAYDRVRPTAATVRDDAEHGSEYVSIRAMEVLRDTAGAVRAGGSDAESGWETAVRTAEELLRARPSMAAPRNRVNRIVSRSAADRTATAIERVAIEEIAAAVDAGRRAASEAVPLVSGATVLTLSRSGTLLPALVEGPERVVIAESRPGREGVGVAERVAEAGAETALCADSAVAYVLGTEPIDAVLLGADTVLRDGTLVNKVGSRGVAVAAAAEGIPVYAVTATDKISPAASPALETGPDSAVYDGEGPIDVLNPRFDVTPPQYVSGFLTDEGRLDAETVSEIASAHDELRSWRRDRDA